MSDVRQSTATFRLAAFGLVWWGTIHIWRPEMFWNFYTLSPCPHSALDFYYKIHATSLTLLLGNPLALPLCHCRRHMWMIPDETTDGTESGEVKTRTVTPIPCMLNILLPSALVQSNPLDGTPPDNDSIGLVVQYWNFIRPATEPLSRLYCTSFPLFGSNHWSISRAFGHIPHSTQYPHNFSTELGNGKYCFRSSQV